MYNACPLVPLGMGPNGCAFRGALLGFVGLLLGYFSSLGSIEKHAAEASPELSRRRILTRSRARIELPSHKCDIRDEKLQTKMGVFSCWPARYRLVVMPCQRQE